LLQIRDLKTHFFTRSGGVKAVNGVSFDFMPGETLGLVGESGSGKTITVTSILKLLPRGAHILEGEIIFEGENLLHKTEGCPFHPRCREAIDTCWSGEPPPIFHLQDGRQVRCWLREDHHA
jgi:ABC-type dipeptide/oligopeptide/nickel transport system ATPase component